MKLSLIKTFFCLCLCFGLINMAHADGHKHAMSADEKAISEFMNTEMAGAWKSNKPGKVLELFSDSVPLVWFNANTNETVTSKPEREKELKAFFSKHKVVDFTAGDLVVTKLDNNLGLVTTTQKLVVADVATKKEAELLMRVVYEVVKEKDGKWAAYREMSYVADAGN